MKKYIGFLIVAMIAGSAIAATVTNRIGQVITVDSEGVVTAVTDPNVPGSSTNSVVSIPTSIQLDLQGAAALDPTTHTPRQFFDLLLYTTSNKLYMSVGETTNDWVLLN